jgi:hypothetical protein
VASRRPYRNRDEARTFYQLIADAIADMTEHGFDSQARLDNWIKRLALAAHRSLIPEAVMQRTLRQALHDAFNRLVQGAGLMSRHRGIDEYTLAAIKPKLRSELDRRILAATDLIKLNRETSINRTLQRFAGWATSIPIGGSTATNREEARKLTKKALARLPFEERRVIIDQSQKLVASVNAIVAEDGGAIAAVWHSRWREAGYDYRPDHKARDQHVYVMRDNWAIRRGYMKLAGEKYVDQVTQPGEEISCRCRYEYLYTLRDLPARMITKAGKDALAHARAKIGMRRPLYEVRV